MGLSAGFGGLICSVGAVWGDYLDYVFLVFFFKEK